ncbi:MAG: HIT family protein [Gemmataceae bacterium]
MMDSLWAPWRLQYVAAPKKSDESVKDCFICRGQNEQNDKENLIVLRESEVLVVLNRFPYNNGHLLIAPNDHIGELTDLGDKQLLQCMQVIQRMVTILKGTMQPHGFNIGLNLGRAGGAGLPGHLHWHVVPRWNGDTNFMPVLGETKVISQSLEALYELLQGELHKTEN